jgi:hypothetical protein
MRSRGRLHQGDSGWSHCCHQNTHDLPPSLDAAPITASLGIHAARRHASLLPLRTLNQLQPPASRYRLLPARRFLGGMPPGGSSYLLIDSNTVTNAREVGLRVGQGTGGRELAGAAALGGRGSVGDCIQGTGCPATPKRVERAGVQTAHVRACHKVEWGDPLSWAHGQACPTPTPTPPLTPTPLPPPHLQALCTWCPPGFSMRPTQFG